jgi:hypothetical protein
MSKTNEDAARSRAYYAANKEKILARRRLARNNNIQAHRIARRVWCAANKEKVLQHNRNYRRLPKPTRPDPGVCECCGELPSMGAKRLSLDHDHVLGVFRGWLCGPCNTAIGKLGDCLEGVMRAVAYLQRANT